MAADVQNVFIDISGGQGPASASANLQMRSQVQQQQQQQQPQQTSSTPKVAVADAAHSQTAPFTLQRTRWCLIRKNRNKVDELITLITHLPHLTAVERFLLRSRYIELLISFHRRCAYYSLLHRVLRLIVTIGSLLVPALLSVQYDTVYKPHMYWTTWVISLAVTTSNGIFTLFKIDKKYYFTHTINELLWSEGWQYFALTGRYGAAGHLLPAGAAHTHSTMFPFFCHYIEKIKIKQVEEEYYKGVETDQSAILQTQIRNVQQQHTASIPNQGTSKLYPFTPDKNIVKTAENRPAETRSEINAFLENMQLDQQQQQQQSQKKTLDIK